MAENILKLKLDSNEYNNKLRTATRELLDFTEQMRRSGQSMNSVDQNAVEYVRALGQMTTSTNTAKGALREMTNAFTEYSTIYRQMSDEEKKGEFGQGLAQSLEQLKTRINESKASLEEVNSELGNTSNESNATGGILETLAGKFGLNITQAGAMSAALGVTSAAAKVAKDAFFSNEEQLDEWGRVVASSESLYRGFLDALNTGDISGFLSRMDTIVAAARQAYDALDELATFNAFNQINIARTRQTLMNAQNDYREGTGSKEAVQAAGKAYKDELSQRRELQKQAYVSTIVDYANRRGVNAVDLTRVMLGSYGDYKKIKAMPFTGTETTVKTNMYGQMWTQTTKVAANEMERMGDMLRRFNDTELNELQSLGANIFQTGQDMEQVDRQVLRTLRGAQGGTTARGGGAARGGGGGVPRASRGGGGGTPPPPKYVPVEGSIDAQAALVAQLQKQWKAAADDDSRAKIKEQIEEANKKLDEMQGKVAPPEGSLKALKDDLKELQSARELLTDPIDIQVQDVMIKDLQEQIDTLSGKTVKVGLEVADRATLADQINAELAAANEELDTNTLRNLMKYSIENGLNDLNVDWASLQQQMAEGMNIPDEQWQKVVDDINAKLEAMKLPPIVLNVKTGGVTQGAKEVKESWQDAAKAVQAVGNALQQVEDPSVKIAGLVGEAIANVALGFAQATAADSKFGVFGWIAAIAGGIGTMLSTISAIKSATAGSYAEGGIIPGHSFSGDNMLANVNSGELILSRAAQGNLASQLSGNNQNITLHARLTGEDIYLAADSHARRVGKGGLMTVRQ